MGDKDIHLLLKSIRPKVNVIAWLEFELTYFQAAVHHFSHWASADVIQLVKGGSQQLIRNRLTKTNFDIYLPILQLIYSLFFLFFLSLAF